MWRETTIEQTPAVLETVSRTAPPPVLIRVPAMRNHAGRRPAHHAHNPRVRRRRLRREVRMVASGLTLGGVLAAGLLAVGGVRPSSFRAEVSRAARSLGSSLESWGADAAESTEGADPFAVELHAPVTVPEAVPVAFPGYLLPHDDREEARHAGS